MPLLMLSPPHYHQLSAACGPLSGSSSGAAKKIKGTVRAVIKIFPAAVNNSRQLQTKAQGSIKCSEEPEQSGHIMQITLQIDNLCLYLCFTS